MKKRKSRKHKARSAALDAQADALLRWPSVLPTPPGYQMGPSCGHHMYGDSLTGRRFGSERERDFVERVAPALLQTALSQPTVMSAPCEWAVRWATVLWDEIEKRAPKAEVEP